MKHILILLLFPLIAGAQAPGTFVSILDFGAATNKHDNTEAIQ